MASVMPQQSLSQSLSSRRICSKELPGGDDDPKYDEKREIELEDDVNFREEFDDLNDGNDIADNDTEISRTRNEKKLSEMNVNKEGFDEEMQIRRKNDETQSEIMFPEDMSEGGVHKKGSISKLILFVLLLASSATAGIVIHRMFSPNKRSSQKINITPLGGNEEEKYNNEPNMTSIDELRHSNDILTQQNRLLTSKVSSLERYIETLTNDITTLRINKVELEAEVRRHNESNIELESSLEIIRNEHDDLVERNTVLNRTVSVLSDKILQMNETNSNLTRQVHDMDLFQRNLTNTTEHQSEMIHSLTDVNYHLSNQVQETTNEMKHCSDTVYRLVGQNKGARNEILALTSANDLLNMTNIGLYSQRDQLEHSLGGCQNRTKVLDENITDLNDLVRDVNALNDGLKIDLSGCVDDNWELRYENDVLNGTILMLSNDISSMEELNYELNKSNEIYIQSNNQLRVIVTDYQEQNTNLNQSINKLNDELSTLTEINVALNTTLDQYETLNNDLEVQITNLTSLNQDLNHSLVFLNSTVETLESQNDRLQNLNANLKNIVTWFDDSTNLQASSYDQVIEYLSQKIQVDRLLLFHAIQENFEKSMKFWNCALRSRFRFRSFVRNEDTNSVIGENDVQDVLDYLDENIMSELCVDMDDFERFVGVKYNKKISDSTLLQLESFVSDYTVRVLDYYFPDEGDGGAGLDVLDWEEADYDCRNLAVDKRYSYT